MVESYFTSSPTKSSIFITNNLSIYIQKTKENFKLKKRKV